MKENKIITAESEYGETDLYDGMIMSALENIFYLDGLDHDTLESVYDRVLHYLYMLQYVNDPENHPNECFEAHAIKNKLGDFNVQFLVDVAAKLQVILGRV